MIAIYLPIKHKNKLGSERDQKSKFLNKIWIQPLSLDAVGRVSFLYLIM